MFDKKSSLERGPGSTKSNKPANFIVYKSIKELTVPKDIAFQTQHRAVAQKKRQERINMRN